MARRATDRMLEESVMAVAIGGRVTDSDSCGGKDDVDAGMSVMPVGTREKKLEEGKIDLAGSICEIPLFISRTQLPFPGGTSSMQSVCVLEAVCVATTKPATQKRKSFHLAVYVLVSAHWLCHPKIEASTQAPPQTYYLGKQNCSPPWTLILQPLFKS